MQQYNTVLLQYAQYAGINTHKSCAMWLKPFFDLNFISFVSRDFKLVQNKR